MTKAKKVPRDPKVRVKIQLTKEQYDALREEAERTGESMSTLVRQRIEAGK